MKLNGDYLVSINNFSYTTNEFITIITTKGTGKRVRLQEFELSTRTRRGIQVIREVKSNPYEILTTFTDDPKNYIGIKNGEINTIKLTELPIADRYSTGTSISNNQVFGMFEVKELINPKDIKEEVKEISLESIDDKIMTIDDFLKDIEK